MWKLLVTYDQQIKQYELEQQCWKQYHKQTPTVMTTSKLVELDNTCVEITQIIIGYLQQRQTVFLQQDCTNDDAQTTS